jgi:integrase
MNQITIAAPTGVVLAEADAAAARTFAELEKAASTRRSYRVAFRIFADWCHARGLVPVPASPDTVAAFLAAEATAGARASTIAHRAAAIRYAHRLAGHETPTSAETVRAVMRGIRRTIGTAPERKAPATADVIREMRLCPPTLAGQRDRALLALGFAGAFRRSELVALSVADLVEMPDGFRVLIRHSKTDQEGAGQEIAIPRGYRLRPVEAVQTWLEAAAITEGPVFRRPGVPRRAEGRQAAGRSADAAQRRRDRQDVCRTGRPRSGCLCRPLAAGWLHHVRSRSWRVGAAHCRPVPPPEPRHAPWRASGGFVPRPCGGIVPVTASTTDEGRPARGRFMRGALMAP